MQNLQCIRGLCADGIAGLCVVWVWVCRPLLLALPVGKPPGLCISSGARDVGRQFVFVSSKGFGRRHARCETAACLPTSTAVVCLLGFAGTGQVRGGKPCRLALAMLQQAGWVVVVCSGVWQAYRCGAGVVQRLLAGSSGACHVQYLHGPRNVVCQSACGRGRGASQHWWSQQLVSSPSQAGLVHHAAVQQIPPKLAPATQYAPACCESVRACPCLLHHPCAPHRHRSGAQRQCGAFGAYRAAYSNKVPSVV